jgi:hypothetical protein
VDWALARRGESLRRVLVAEIDRLEFPRCDDLPEHGRVGHAAVHPEYERIRAEARERLASIGWTPRPERSTLSSAIGRRSLSLDRPAAPTRR